jgi:hypothetical protein
VLAALAGMHGKNLCSLVDNRLAHVPVNCVKFNGDPIVPVTVAFVTLAAEAHVRIANPQINVVVVGAAPNVAVVAATVPTALAAIGTAPVGYKSATELHTFPNTSMTASPDVSPTGHITVVFGHFATTRAASAGALAMNNNQIDNKIRNISYPLNKLAAAEPSHYCPTPSTS